MHKAKLARRSLAGGWGGHQRAKVPEAGTAGAAHDMRSCMVWRLGREEGWSLRCWVRRAAWRWRFSDRDRDASRSMESRMALLPSHRPFGRPK